MSRSAGNLSRWGRIFPLSRAVRYREFRINRAVYLGTGVLMVLPWIVQLANNTWVWNRLTKQVLQSTIFGYVNGALAFSVWDVMLAGFLGVAVWWNDRSRGRLGLTLEGPVTRREALLAKFWMTWGTIAATSLLNGILLVVTVVLSGLNGWAGPVLVKTLLLLTVETVVAAATIAFGAAMGSAIFAAITTAIVGVIPLVAASVVTHFAYPPWPARPQPWLAALMNALSRLSPFTFDYGTVSLSVSHSALFLLGSVLLACFALRWWDRAPQERFHDPVFFPALWYAVYAFLAVLSAFVTAALIQPLVFPPTRETWQFVAEFAAFAVIEWFMWRAIMRRIGRTALRWGPDA